jgi:hypothetical protein
MVTANTDGQHSDQGEETPEGNESGEESRSSGKEDRFAKMDARFELLNGSITELRQAILDSRRPTQAQVEVPDDDDDDQPLTPSKVRRAVNQAVAHASAANQGLADRKEWDNKAKSEFPLHDPEFMLNFRREWKERTDSGLDPKHPKAVYDVAKITARLYGSKKPAPKKDPETTHSSEAPSQSRQPAQRSQRSNISDDHPSVRFYTMKGNRTKDQIENFKKKLAEKEPRRSAR